MTENDYASNRVPMQSRIRIIKVTLVRIGYLTSLGQFMLGATLGHSMTFRDAILATFFGSLILEFVSLGLGLAGMKEGLSTSILAKWCGFGKIGSAIIGLAIATSLLGWFGIQNSVLAEGIQYTFDYKINHINFGSIRFVPYLFSGFWFSCFKLYRVNIRAIIFYRNWLYFFYSYKRF